MVANHLRRRYGDAVKLEYHDLAVDSEREKFPEVVKVIETSNVPVPVVAIDGVLRMAGLVDFWSIVDLIEAKGNDQPD